MAIKVVIIYMMGQMEFDIEHGGNQCVTLAGSVDHVATNVLGIRYESLAIWEVLACLLSLDNNDTMFANLEEEHNSDSKEDLY